jgi:hypothetical protein
VLVSIEYFGFGHIAMLVDNVARVGRTIHPKAALNDTKSKLSIRRRLIHSVFVEALTVLHERSYRMVNALMFTRGSI